MADTQVIAELLPGLELAVRQAARQDVPQPSDHFFADSFPEYKSAAQDLRTNVSRLLQQARQVLLLPKQRSTLLPPSAAAADSDSDPEAAVETQVEQTQQVIEDCLERVDRALDDAQQQLQEYKDGRIACPPGFAISGPLANWRLTGGGTLGAACTLDAAAAGRGRQPLSQAAAGAGRPQDSFATPVDNSSNPWWPDFLHLRGRASSPGAGEVAAPHPFAQELQQLRYQPEQLTAGAPQLPPDLATCPATWVDTPQALASLVSSLEGCREVALDLEHHSYRSFQGFTCLMQVSSRTQDWLVDTLALREHLGPALLPLLTNPGVVKVLHGADSDVVWLQRDFGLYLVNMFDTGQAARVLGYPSASLAHLLTRHVGFTPDKRYQLADWRLRPLSPAMREYARCDTHFLLYCYDVLRRELLDRGEAVPSTYAVLLPVEGPQGALGTVLERSRQLCLTSYQKELLTSSSAAAAAQRWQLVLPPRQMAVFAGLYAWRDTTARRLDEGTGYVLPKGQLMTLAKEMPTTTEQVLKVLGRSGGQFARRSAEAIAQVVVEAQAAFEQQKVASSSCTAAANATPAAATAAAVEALQEPDAAATRQVVKPRVLAPLTGKTRSVGNLGDHGSGAAGAAGPSGTPTQQEQQQGEQQEQQQQQERQVRPKVLAPKALSKPGNSGIGGGMAAVFGKRPAAPSAAALLFKRAVGAAGVAKATGGTAGANAGGTGKPAFQLPFQLNPQGGGGAAGVADGAQQQQQQQQLDGAGSSSSSEPEDGDVPLQKTTAADVRAAMNALRAENDTAAAAGGLDAPGTTAAATAAAAGGGTQRAMAAAAAAAAEKAQSAAEGGGEEAKATGGYKALSEAFGSAKRKRGALSRAMPSTAAGAATAGAGADDGVAANGGSIRSRPLFGQGGDSSGSELDGDSEMEDLAELAKQQQLEQQAAGGSFDYASARSAAAAAAAAAGNQQQQSRPQRGRRGRGRGGRGSARGAAMAAAAASLAAVRAQEGHAVAFDPFNLPDENLIKGGKRSAVEPRSGNRSLSFK